MTMTTRWMRLLGALLLATIGAYGAQAGTVQGTVKNGTSGKPAAGVEVILIQLQGGMQPVGKVTTDAQGHFTIENPNAGTQPMLVRAVYKGINFHQPLPPGKTDLQIDVFEPSKDPHTINVASRIVFFQPNGDKLIVGEEYTVANNSQPPQAYFKTDGNFDFAIPENAQLQQVAAAGPAGMPVVQAPIDKTKNHYAISYAFRPGQSTVRYSYELPYAGNSAKISVQMIYAAARLLVVAPPTMQISGDGLQAGGQEQGMSIYGRENVASGAAVAINVSGTAPPPDANADAGQQGGGGQSGGGQGAEQGGAATGVNIMQVPGRLDVLKWPLVAGFIGIFAIGAIMLARKPVAVTTAAEYVETPTERVVTKKSRQVAPVVAAAAETAPTLAKVDAEVGTSLDSLKDRIFRLELRRQAGTISEEEYAAERTEAEKILRDLVRG